MKAYSFINSWRAAAKLWNKFAIKIRLGKITVFDFYYDHGKKLGGLVVFNFGFRKNKRNG